MWNNKPGPDDGEDESWEVRAFEEDTTGNLLGCTWPPRSYTCAFCRREFRSAQALGGHMNVHRRDRARMHHDAPPSRSVSDAPPSLFIPTSQQEFYGNRRLCLLLYPHSSSSIIAPIPPMDLPSPGLLPTSNKLQPTDDYKSTGATALDSNELDLELRLGRRSTP